MKLASLEADFFDSYMLICGPICRQLTAIYGVAQMLETLASLD
jgi:hypothetical protein